jgi:hypothetical protein
VRSVFDVVARASQRRMCLKVYWARVNGWIVVYVDGDGLMNGGRVISENTRRKNTYERTTSTPILFKSHSVLLSYDQNDYAVEKLLPNIIAVRTK